MKLKALSHYNGDMDTRFGDCILLYDSTSLVVYDCGHAQHAQEIEDFLCKNALISKVHIVISHNDSDHTDGIEKLMEYLISDNTGSGATSGGSDKLVEYMKNERYSPAFNTKSGVVSIPISTYGNISNTRTQGVKLGEMDCKF